MALCNSSSVKAFIFFIVCCGTVFIYITVSIFLFLSQWECPADFLKFSSSFKNDGDRNVQKLSGGFLESRVPTPTIAINVPITPPQKNNMVILSSPSISNNGNVVHHHPKFVYDDDSPFSSSYSLSSQYILPSSSSSSSSSEFVSVSSAISASSPRIADLDIDNRFYFHPSLDTPEDFAAEVLRVEIFHRMKSLQHPDVSMCPNASYLVCTVQSMCGFMCTFHEIMHCVSRAQQKEKTAVLVKSLILNGGDWSSWFKPISSCQEYFWDSYDYDNKKPWKDSSLDVEIFRPSNDAWVENRYSVPSYMKKVVNRESMLYLGAWYLGVYEWYVLNLNDRLKEFIQKKEEELNLEPQHCDIGLQIRRTDKIGWGEMDKLHVREYMREVDHFAVPGRNFHNIFSSEEKHFNKTIYLATDDPNIIDELNYWLPVYRILNNKNGASFAYASSHVKRNLHTEGIDHLLYDIFSTVKCDDFVGTFTSNVGRIILELQAMRYLNPAAHSSSLDSVWYGRV